MEKLDINNIIEAQEIKNMIRHKKKLVDFFDDMIKKINIQINDEKPVFKIQYNETIDDISHTNIEYATSSSEDETTEMGSS